MATFSERFKELRKEKGMSQRELATALHMSNSAVAMYETGKRQPDLEALEQIADYFNVDMDYLLGRKNTTHRIIEIDPNHIDYSIQIGNDERFLLETYVKLANEKKRVITDLIEMLSK